MVNQKFFVPLENNPEVFTHLVQKLGVSPELGFHDVYNIDDPDLLAFLPRPVYALLFICPGQIYHIARDAEDAALPVYEGSGPQEPVIWYKQTIGHACGLMGLLHGVSNGPARQYVLPGSDLDLIIQQAIDLPPAARADLLYNSVALETAHASAAQKGDSAAPQATDPNYFHYICFVKADDGHLWELNGGMNGPVDRGALGPEEDVLSERALDLSVRTFFAKAKEAGVDDVGFSIVALAPTFD